MCRGLAGRELVLSTLGAHLKSPSGALTLQEGGLGSPQAYQGVGTLGVQSSVRQPPTQGVHDNLGGRVQHHETYSYSPRWGSRYDSKEDRSPSPEPPGPLVLSKAIRRAPFPPLFRASTTITKYSGETKPELWLADYRLACQLGGTNDDNLIIRNLPLFLSDSPEPGSSTSYQHRSMTGTT
jgi:hypothetical protein